MRAELAVVRQAKTDSAQGTAYRHRLPHAAIVGYTNAGKSSLLNALSGSEVLAEDKLYSPPWTRRLAGFTFPTVSLSFSQIPGEFVRRLPHGLIDAFKATLEEAILSDFLVHVLDASSPDVFGHFETTREVLAELGADEKKTIVALNKHDLIDAVDDEHRLREYFGPAAIFLSVHERTGLDNLIHCMNTMLLDRVRRMELRLPYRSDGPRRSPPPGREKSSAREYAAEGIDLVAIVSTTTRLPSRGVCAQQVHRSSQHRMMRERPLWRSEVNEDQRGHIPR